MPIRVISSHVMQRCVCKLQGQLERNAAHVLLRCNGLDCAASLPAAGVSL